MNMKTLRHVFTVLALIVAFAVPTFAQTTLNTTTLSAAAIGNPGVTTTTISVASATNISASGTSCSNFPCNYLFVDQELMQVLSVSGSNITVFRGQGGTIVKPHNNGAFVYIMGGASYFQDDPSGSCTPTLEVLPHINVTDGIGYACIQTNTSSTAFVAQWRPVSLGGGPSGAQPVSSVTGVWDAAYTALPTDVVISLNTLSAGRTITLPSPTGLLGKQYTIMDASGVASVRNITISQAGGVNGGTTAIITTNFGALTCTAVVNSRAGDTLGVVRWVCR